MLIRELRNRLYLVIVERAGTQATEPRAKLCLAMAGPTAVWGPKRISFILPLSLNAYEPSRRTGQPIRSHYPIQRSVNLR